MKVDVRLNAVVDPERANGRALADLARLVAAGGATLIQLRDKHGATRQMIGKWAISGQRSRMSPS